MQGGLYRPVYLLTTDIHADMYISMQHKQFCNLHIPIALFLNPLAENLIWVICYTFPY